MSAVTLAFWLAASTAGTCATEPDPSVPNAELGDDGDSRIDECSVSSAARSADVAERAYPSMLFNVWTVAASGAYTSLATATGVALWFGWAVSGFWDLRGLFGGIALCTCGWIGGCVSLWLLRGVFLREAIDRGWLAEDPFPMGAKPAPSVASPASSDPVPY